MEAMILLVRGGSVSAGHGVSSGWVHIVGTVLQKRGIHVINRSRYGETSFDGIGTYETDIAPFRPQVLVVQFAVDDAFQAVYRSEFQENLVRMVKLTRLRFNPAIFLATSHAFDNPYDMDAVNLFYRSLQIVASDLGCGYIPLHHHWTDYLVRNGLRSSDLTQNDIRYPNERGHEVLAKAAASWLDAVLPFPLEGPAEGRKNNGSAV